MLVGGTGVGVLGVYALDVRNPAAFGADKAALLLTARPPFHPDLPPPDLRGLTRRGGPVTYLWVLVVDEETFGIARGRDSRNALRHLQETGGTWVQ